MANALDLPGMPTSRRYVGLSVATSNSQEAFITPLAFVAYTFSSA